MGRVAGRHTVDGMIIHGGLGGLPPCGVPVLGIAGAGPNSSTVISLDDARASGDDIGE